jgi:hypothetical protein
MRFVVEKMLAHDQVPAFIKRTRYWWILGWLGSVFLNLGVNLAPHEWNSLELALLIACYGLLFSGGFGWTALRVVRSDMRTGSTLRRSFKHSYTVGASTVYVYEYLPCRRDDEPHRFRWEVLKFSCLALLTGGIMLLLSGFVFILNSSLRSRLWLLISPLDG